MGWSDDRVEVLKKLWQDGLSASQIARQLGGVSRNAVIGKVHRMGLSGRAAPSKPRRTALSGERPARPATPRQTLPRARGGSGAAPGSAPTTSRPLRIRYLDEAPGSATVLTLGAHMCKWPIGDPLSDGFTFCGRRADDCGPYCHEHAQVAYQPAQAKKKSTAAELARSLRRYL